MKVNLYITSYAEKNLDRRKEIETCFTKNLQAGFQDIWLLIEEKDLEYTKELINRRYPTKSYVNYKVVGAERPSFQQYINQANYYQDERIHVVMNSDIFIEPADLDKIKNLNWQNKLFVALSRWDLHKGGTSTLLDRQDSQDAYFWYGNCNVINALCPNGNAGSDNHICWKFKDAGYKVVNPSKDIKIFHLHNVLGNNYRQGIGGPVIATHICPPPYSFHPPIFINQI